MNVKTRANRPTVLVLYNTNYTLSNFMYLLMTVPSNMKYKQITLLLFRLTGYHFAEIAP